MRKGSTHRREKKVCLHASRLGGTAQIGRPIDRPSAAKSKRCWDVYVVCKILIIIKIK